MGVPAVHTPPSIFWPPPPELPANAHVWVIGGILEGVSCDLVAADHVVPLVRHAVGLLRGQPVERLAPTTVLTAHRQYQLRVRAPGRIDIAGVWTVVAPFAPPALARCVLRDGVLAIDVRTIAIVEVRAGGATAIEVITGAGELVVPGEAPVTVCVRAPDGAMIDERILSP